MVFHIRCFSFRYVLDIHELNTQANSSADDFHTAPSNFDGRQMEPTHMSQPLRVFTLDELKYATRNFDISSKIKEGKFADVYMGKIKSLEHPFDDICVAMKRGKIGQQGYKPLVTELKYLGEINHRNLVKLIGYCSEDYGNENQLILVYEYMDNRSLDDHLESYDPLSWKLRLDIARDVATGLAYLHEGMDREIIFGDLKLSNILLDWRWNAKLSDFGFTKKRHDVWYSNLKKRFVYLVSGKKGYEAPEYAQSGKMTSKIDVWSYGIFLLELIIGRHPEAQKKLENNPQLFRWVGCSARGVKSKLTVDIGLFGKYTEKSMQKIFTISKKCLVKDPSLRPKMSEVLEMVQEAIALDN